MTEPRIKPVAPVDCKVLMQYMSKVQIEIAAYLGSSNRDRSYLNDSAVLRVALIQLKECLDRIQPEKKPKETHEDPHSAAAVLGPFGR